MENASKALLIAAAVLIGIIIISIGVAIVSSQNGSTKQAGRTGETMETATAGLIGKIKGKQDYTGTITDGSVGFVSNGSQLLSESTETNLGGNNPGLADEENVSEAGGNNAGLADEENVSEAGGNNPGLAGEENVSEAGGNNSGLAGEENVSEAGGNNPGLADEENVSEAGGNNSGLADEELEENADNTDNTITISYKVGEKSNNRSIYEISISGGNGRYTLIKRTGNTIREMEISGNNTIVAITKVTYIKVRDSSGAKSEEIVLIPLGQDGGSDYDYI